MCAGLPWIEVVLWTLSSASRSHQHLACSAIHTKPGNLSSSHSAGPSQAMRGCAGSDLSLAEHTPVTASDTAAIPGFCAAH